MKKVKNVIRDECTKCVCFVDACNRAFGTTHVVCMCNYILIVGKHRPFKVAECPGFTKEEILEIRKNANKQG